MRYKSFYNPQQRLRYSKRLKRSNCLTIFRSVDSFRKGDILSIDPIFPFENYNIPFLDRIFRSFPPYYDVLVSNRFYLSLLRKGGRSVYIIYQGSNLNLTQKLYTNILLYTFNFITFYNRSILILTQGTQDLYQRGRSSLQLHRGEP